MKEIQAIIQPFMLEPVLRALATIPELPGLTVSEVAGWGRTQADEAHDVVHHGGHAFAAMSKIQVVVPDRMVAVVVNAIGQRARTGNAGDGKIFVYPVIDVVKIRTGHSEAESPGEP